MMLMERSLEPLVIRGACEQLKSESKHRPGGFSIKLLVLVEKTSFKFVEEKEKNEKLNEITSSNIIIISKYLISFPFSMKPTILRLGKMNERRMNSKVKEWEKDQHLENAWWDSVQAVFTGNFLIHEAKWWNKINEKFINW